MPSLHSHLLPISAILVLTLHQPASCMLLPSLPSLQQTHSSSTPNAGVAARLSSTMAMLLFWTNYQCLKRVLFCFNLFSILLSLCQPEVNIIQPEVIIPPHPPFLLQIFSMTFPSSFQLPCQGPLSDCLIHDTAMHQHDPGFCFHLHLLLLDVPLFP